MNADIGRKVLCALVALVMPLSAGDLRGWTADVAAAQQRAKVEKKAVLLQFSGSDWCPPCMAMRKNVFSKIEFVEEASKHFILVDIDFPESDPKMQEKNRPLLEKYKVEGYPMVVLLNESGKEFGRFFASEYPTLEKFMLHLHKALEKRDMD